MLAKPWWPEPRYELPLHVALDPVALFRHQVLCVARRMGLSPQAQVYALAATNGLPARHLRPDLARQAKAWVNHHRHPPRRIRVRRVCRLAAIRPIVPCPSYSPPPARLAREALVTRLRDEEHRSFK